MNWALLGWTERIAALVGLIAYSAYLGAIVRQMVEVLRPWFQDGRMKWMGLVVLGFSYSIVGATKVTLLRGAGIDLGGFSLVADSLLVAGAAQGVNDAMNVAKRLGDRK